MTERSPELNEIIEGLRAIKLRLEFDLKRVTAALNELEPQQGEDTEKSLMQLIVENSPTVLNYVRDVAPPARAKGQQLWTNSGAISRETGLSADLTRRIVRRLKTRGEIQTKANNRLVAAAPLRQVRIKVGEGEVS